MNQITQKIKTEFANKKHFIIYSIIGFTGLGLDFTLFLVLTQIFQTHVIIANIISMSAGATNNFFLNAFLNFKKTNKLFKRFIYFFLISLIGQLISHTLIYIFVEIYLFSKIYIKAGTILIVTLVQYTLNKKFSFKN